MGKSLENINIDNRFDSLNPELLEKIKFILDGYNKTAEEIVSNKIKTDSFIRLQDYYDANSDAKTNIENLKAYFPNADDSLIIQFCMYMLKKESEDIFCIIENPEFGVDDLLEIIEDDIIDNLIYIISYVRSMLDTLTKEDEEIEFLNKDNPFKIMFIPETLDDIKKLPKNVFSSFVRKLNTPLATESIIKLSEKIDHTNEAFGTSYARIQFANDYRIAYERYKGVTIILGVTLKTGKEIDYTRYDSIAKKNESIHETAELFSMGDENEEHNEIVKYIIETYSKVKGK